MQNINVHRYSTPSHYQGYVEPDDRSWIVFVAADGEVSFWRCCTTQDEEGKTVRDYIDVELPFGCPEGVVSIPNQKDLEADNIMKVRNFSSPDGLSFRIVPAKDFDSLRASLTRQEAEEDRFTKPEEKGFFAMLDQRSIACWGETEHEATTSLLNYVARLCTAGCLDHTGAPISVINPRRYQAAFAQPPADKLVGGYLTKGSPAVPE